MKRYLKVPLALFVTVGLVACASQQDKPPTSTQDMSQAVRDFIETSGLESVDQVKVGPTDSIKKISGVFILYKGRRENHIMEFDRRCDALDDYRVITPDRRWDLKALRPRVDTIRNCRIAKIYRLTEAELVELKNIGAAPGEHG
jgi:hypothetical protein